MNNLETVLECINAAGTHPQLSHREELKHLVLCTAVALISLSPPAHAESTNDSGLMLEEVIVTAQKRAESMQDVPVAIYAVHGKDLRADGIEKMASFAPTVPGLHVSEAFGGDQIFLRGLGPGVNFGFEQAVGQVVDGFFYGRSRFSRLQFLDLERIEVLKGPQGAIVGKNTTAGAINMTTARPTRDFEGWAIADYEFEGAEGYSLEGAVSGPLSDSLSGRLALRYEDRDGFLQNTSTGHHDEARDDIAGRVSILYEPIDTFNALLQYAHADVERVGRNIQITHCTDAMRAALPLEDCKLDDTRRVTDSRAGIGGFEFQKTEADTYGLTLNWEFDGFTLTSLTGHAEYDYLDAGTGSYVDIENFMSNIAEDYEQFTQELRIVSAGDRNVDYIVGVFYQDHTLDSIFDLNVTQLGPSIFNINRHINTLQSGETLAAFGQAVIHLDDQWDMTLEGRYTREEKDGRSIQFPTQIYSDIQFNGPGSGGPAGIFDVHDIEADRTENDFSPGLIISWRPTDDAMYYTSLKKGFKGGGFDHQLSANQTDASDGRFSFDEEEVLSLEVGGKLTLDEGAARLNIAIFRNQYDDLQVSALTGISSFSVGNAASAVTQGAELDFSWRLTEALSFAASVALLDAEYEDFEGAPCSQFQISNDLCSNGVQDLSNQPLQYAPTFSYNVSATYVWYLANGLEVTGFVRAYGEDDKDLAQDLDPYTVQASYNKIDARLGLANAGGQWELTLLGRNLTNKETMGFANDVALFPGSYFGLTESLRSIALQATLRF